MKVTPQAVEAKTMNDEPVSDDEAETERQPVKYSSVLDGELVNAGESPMLRQLHDYLGSPPSPNGE